MYLDIPVFSKFRIPFLNFRISQSFRIFWFYSSIFFRNFGSFLRISRLSTYFFRFSGSLFIISNDSSLTDLPLNPKNLFQFHSLHLLSNIRLLSLAPVTHESPDPNSGFPTTESSQSCSTPHLINFPESDPTADAWRHWWRHPWNTMHCLHAK